MINNTNLNTSRLSSIPFNNLSKDNVMYKQYMDMKGWRRHFYTESKLTTKIKDLAHACFFQSSLKNLLISQYSDLHKQKLVSHHFEKILSQACFNIGLNENRANSFVDTTNQNSLIKEIKQVIAAIETKGLQVYPEKEIIPGQHIKNILKFLLYDIKFSSDLLSGKNISATLFSNNKKLMKEAREEFKTIFLHIFNNVDKHDDFITDMLIGNLLSLFCYMQPNSGETISVPQKIGDTWKLNEFNIDRINLSPFFAGAPFYALGLTPVTKEGEPILIFKGTTYPQDQGFLTTIIADFTPGHSVGRGLYRLFKNKISKWIKETYSNNGNTPVKVYGQSLGGALAYHVALDNPDVVTIQGYVPPGLLTDKNHRDICGKVFYHENDFISKLGKHPPIVDLYKIITTGNRNKFEAHSRAFGAEDALILRVNRARENARISRTILIILHQIASIIIFPICQVLRLLSSILHETKKTIKRCISPTCDDDDALQLSLG